VGGGDGGTDSCLRTFTNAKTSGIYILCMYAVGGTVAQYSFSLYNNHRIGHVKLCVLVPRAILLVASPIQIWELATWLIDHQKLLYCLLL